MSKFLGINFSLNFEAYRLQLQAEGTYSGLHFPGTPPTVKEAKFKVFRQYPLSELEARSLHFKGSNPVEWIEDHMIDLVLLQGFQEGYDLRDVQVTFRYMPSFIQTEEGPSADGELTPQEAHIYQWSHNRQDDVLILEDNGIDIGRFPVRGPQNYLQLDELQADIKIREVATQESEASQ